MVMRRDRHRLQNQGRRWQLLVLVWTSPLMLTGCPPEGSSTSLPTEQGGSKENKKSGAGDDRRSLQDLSGAERSKTEPRGGNREPGGR